MTKLHDIAVQRRQSVGVTPLASSLLLLAPGFGHSSFWEVEIGFGQ